MSDLISRQAAIDEIGEWIKAFLENGHKESAADARLIQDGIIQLPSAQPDQRWIPCSEKLPEENMTRVLTTVKTPHKGLNARSGTYYDGLFMNDNGDVWKATAKELKAWMPLPEAYREEK